MGCRGKTFVWKQGERRYAKEFCNEQNKANTKLTPIVKLPASKQPHKSELHMTAPLSLSIPITCRAKTYKHTGIPWKKIQGSVVRINHVLMHLYLNVSSKVVDGITTHLTPINCGICKYQRLGNVIRVRPYVLQPDSKGNNQPRLEGENQTCVHCRMAFLPTAF